MITYKKGDIIFRSKPFVYTVKPELLNVLCYSCLRPLPSVSHVPADEEKENQNVDVHCNGILRTENEGNVSDSKATREDLDGGCFDINTDFPCPRCHIPLYCSEKCRNIDWFGDDIHGETPQNNQEAPETPLVAIRATGRHQRECLYLRRLGGRPEAQKASCDFFLMLGIVLKRRNGQEGDAAGDCVPMSETPRTVASLLTHSEKMDDTRRDCLSRIKFLLIKVLDSVDLPSDDTLLSLFGALQINCFGIRDGAWTGIGEGLYLQPSIVDHSCQRNAVFYFDGPVICIQAIQDVTDLSEVRISYSELFAPAATRQSRFSSGYYFQCQCQLCMDPAKIAETYPVACGSPHCQFPRPSDSRLQDPCPTCGHSLSPIDCENRLATAQRMIRRYLEGIEELDDRIEVLGRNAKNPADVQYSLEEILEDCQAIVKKCEGELHPGSMLLGMAYDRMGRVLLNRKDGEYGRALAVMRKSVPALRNCFGAKKADPRVAVQLMLTGLLAFLSGPATRQESITFLSEARAMFLECDSSGKHGKRSILGEICRIVLKRLESRFEDNETVPGWTENVEMFKVLNVYQWSSCTGYVDGFRLFVQRVVLIMSDFEQIAHPKWFLI